MARTRAVFELKDIDKGWKQLVAAATKAASERGAHAKAGIIGAKAQEEHPDEEGGGKLTNVALGAIHEFGAPSRGIPERSFIRATFDMHRREYLQELRELVGFWFDRKGKVLLLRALGIMGMKMARDMKARILEGSGIPPPNAPSTIAQKLRWGKWKGKSDEEVAGDIAAGKGPRPLVGRTGHLVGAISHEAVKGRGSE